MEGRPVLCAGRSDQNNHGGILMTNELITFIAMVAVFLLGCFLAKLPVSISMVLSAIAGSLVGGHGIALRHLVEGMFSYVDTILVIATAMIFMKVIQDSGALDAISSVIIERFHKVPALMLCLIMLIIMFPGMITGSSTAAPSASATLWWTRYSRPSPDML